MQPPATPLPLPAVPVNTQKIGRPILAWVLILAVVGFTIWENQGGSTEQAIASREQTDLLLFRTQARIMIGMAELLGSLPGQNKAVVYGQAKALDTGPVDQRLRFVVLAGELAGPEEALTQLDALKKQIAQHKDQVSATPKQVRFMQILSRLYAVYGGVALLVPNTVGLLASPLDQGPWIAATRSAQGPLPSGSRAAPSIPPEEKALLRQELGWFGALALAPAGTEDQSERNAVLRPARRGALAYMGVLTVLGVLGFLGLIALIVFLIYLFAGWLRRGIHCGVPHGAVYAETFALYMLFYLVGGRVMSWLLQREWVSHWTWLDHVRLSLSGVLALASLVVLVWPVLRGIPWREVRQEIGFNLGGRPAVEPFLGLGGYAMALPILALGVVTVVFLMALQKRLPGSAGGDDFSPPDVPSHPIIKYLSGPDWWPKIQVLILACVIAPIVEETMFRGVLYRHLREATCRFHLAWSILLSGFVASLIFAIIHPQGIVASPALMALAFGFTLVREWRGTVVPGVVAHGLNNGLVTTLAILLMSD
jgi:membrane protease YdiL (CAAX protease family)